jgi:class 3 adenylate cyclase
VTVVFCDVVGSTALGESRDPEALERLLATYFRRMRGIVESHGGTVEKFIGDAVVAVFGVPVAHEDDALRALRAALEMREALPGLGVEARFGVNTGVVVTSADDTLVAGDAVNVAARLQQTASPGEVLIGAPTLALVGEAATVAELQPLELKGKTEPVAAFRLLGVGEAPERHHGSRFVGRGGELAFLEEAWDRAVEGSRCELVTVVGEPGVGKSRLVAQFTATLEARVVNGRCLSYGEGISYFPVVEVVRQLGTVPNDSAVAAAIGSLLGESEAATSPDEIAWAFRKLLETAAAERPLPVVFDDIQWGEETFLDLVEHVALFSAGCPILLVCLARPELIERRPRWPPPLRLEPLPAAEVEELVPATVPEGLRERIVHAAGGNPLFVTEMVAMAAEAGNEVVVPATLKAVLAARIDQLERAERGVLECGAVEGEVFHLASVQALVPAGSQLTPHLSSLVRRELIRPDRGLLPGEDAFRFCHLLVRDAAYDALPKATRAQLHERFAGWLAEYGPELVTRDEIGGYHLQQAYHYRVELGDPDEVTRRLGERAAEKLAGAGRRAFARDDYAAAANLLGRALELGIADPRARMPLQLDLNISLSETGHRAEAEALLIDTHEVAGELGDRGIAALALVHHARLRMNTVGALDAEECERISRTAVDIFTELSDPVGLAHSVRLLANALRRQQRAAESCVAAERALIHADDSGSQWMRRNILPTLAMSLFDSPIPVGEAVVRLEQLRSLGEEDRIYDALVSRAVAPLLAMGGRFEEALDQIERSSPILDELDQFHNSWSPRSWPPRPGPSAATAPAPSASTLPNGPS